MKKILIYNDLVYGGGVENVMLNLTLFLVSKGYKVTLASSEYDKSNFSRLYPRQVKYIAKTRFTKNRKRYSLKWLITGVINKIYHAFFLMRLKSHFDVAVAMKEGPSMKELKDVNADKKIAWIHVDYNYFHWTKSCFDSDEDEINTMKKYDRIVCVSRAAAESVVNTIGNPGNLCVRYNSLNVESIVRQSEESVDFRKNKLTLVSVGRLSELKNYPLLLKACKALQDKYDFQLLILGDGPDREKLEAQIEKDGLKCVKLMGNVSNPYPYIKAADFFVSSAVSESYGLAVQEALILGVPVIAVSCPAIEEVFSPQYGLLVNNSFEDLYGGIEKMICDEGFRKDCREIIGKDYISDGLYEGRLQEICGLWE